MDHLLSSLDVFEQRMDVTKAVLKQQLVHWLDRRFHTIKQNVQTLKTRVRARQRRGIGPDSATPEASDDAEPAVEIVSNKECVKHCKKAAVIARRESSTLAAKRPMPSLNVASRKRTKMATTSQQQQRKYSCKFNGCGKSFITDTDLARHERIHLGIQPYSCTWSDCDFSAKTRPNVIKHIRVHHFKLPTTKQAQVEKNIEDDRDPNDYVLVDEEQIRRRLI